MERIEMWASAEVKKLMPGGFLEDADIQQMMQNLVMLDSASINEELSGLLDYSRQDVKKFIKDFV